MKKLTMRPLRFTTLFKVLKEITEYEITSYHSPSVEEIRKRLKSGNAMREMSESRMKEIITELRRLEILHVEKINDKNILKLDPVGRKLIALKKKGDAKEIHQILFQRSKPYRCLTETIKKFGQLEIIKKIKEDESGRKRYTYEGSLIEKLENKMNPTLITNCLQWGEILNVFQFFIGNTNGKTIYYTLDRQVPYEQFVEAIEKKYCEMVKQKKDQTIELNRIREVVCLELKISRELFRKNLEKYYMENRQKVSLYSGPPSLDVGGEFRKQIRSLGERIKYQEGINIRGVNRKYIKIEMI